LARCIEDDMPEAMLIEATWVITNICSGQSIHCECFVATDLLERIVELASDPSPAIAQQAAWALGNVAGDSTEHRDLCLATNILDVLETVSAVV
jgi:importin subunit alpha-1